MVALAVIGVILGVITFALEIIGLVLYSSMALTLAQISFYVSLGVIVLVVVAFFGNVFNDDSDELNHILSWVFSLIIGIALIVTGIIILSSGRLEYKSVVVSEQYGVVYAETKTNYEVWKIEDKVEDVYIMSDIDGKSVTLVKKKAANGNETIKTLTFVKSTLPGVGSMTIQEKAFADCGRLTTVTYADKMEYTVEAHVYEGCINLTELNIGSASVSGVYSSANAINIDGGYITIDGANTVTCGSNSSLKCNSVNNSVGSINTLVLKEGASFSEDDKIESYYVTGFFNTTKHYVATAKTIYIPTSVTFIPDYLFGEEGDGCKVYYAGSAEDWAKISIGSTGNSNYTSGKIKVEYNTSYSAG